MTSPNTGYAPWVIEGRGGILISRTGVKLIIDGSGLGGGISEVIAGDALSGGGVGPGPVTINLGDPVGGGVEIRVDDDYTSVLFQQQDEDVGNGANLEIGAQDTTDPAGTGGNLLMHSGGGGAGAGNVVLLTDGAGPGVGAVFSLNGVTGDATISSANDIDLNADNEIHLDCPGLVRIGQGGSTAQHVINGSAAAGIGAQVDSWIVTFNGVQLKIPLHAMV